MPRITLVTLGAPGTLECDQNLTLLVNLCHILNLPLALEKKEGPTTMLIFLGIELDTIKLELRLPAQKLARLKLSLKKWVHLKSCKKRDLESLVGYLHDASALAALSSDASLTYSSQHTIALP